MGKKGGRRIKKQIVSEKNLKREKAIIRIEVKEID